jgi:hypothetical protein
MFWWWWWWRRRKAPPAPTLDNTASGFITIGWSDPHRPPIDSIEVWTSDNNAAWVNQGGADIADAYWQLPFLTGHTIAVKTRYMIGMGATAVGNFSPIVATIIT